MTTDNPLGGPTKHGSRYWETSDFWKDFGERVVTAFLEGILGVFGMEQAIELLTRKSLDLDWWAPFLAAGIMAVASTVKAIIGTQRRGSTTPVSIF